MTMPEPRAQEPGGALIVEDVPAMRAWLVRLLREVCAGATRIDAVGTLAEAHALLDSSPRTLVLVDVGLPDGNGIELIGWLHEHAPSTLAAVISIWGDAETVLAAIRAGAVGYLCKDRDEDELRAALRALLRGGAPIDPFVARRIFAKFAEESRGVDAGSNGHAPPPSRLTRREVEILQLVERGCSNRDIAQATGLSTLTVESHTRAIYRKLAVGSRTAAVFEAKARGWLS